MKKHFVVVEGLNSLEKERFCQQLGSRLGWKVESGEPDEYPYSFFMKKYTEQGIVLSQSHVGLDSESQYWRGKNVFSGIQKKELDTKVWRMGILVFYRKPAAYSAEDNEETTKRRMMESRRELIYWLNAQDVNRTTIHPEVEKESQTIERIVKILEYPDNLVSFPPKKEIVLVSTTA